MSPEKHKAVAPSKGALVRLQGERPQPFPTAGGRTFDRPWPKSRIPGVEPAPTGIRRITPEVAGELQGGLQGVRPGGGSINDTIIGTLPFLAAMLLTAGLLIAFPAIALWLPNLLFD